jgi:DNA-binding MarR family transcriptional regulator
MSNRNSKHERLVQSVISCLRDLDGELDLMDQTIADALGLNRTDAQCMDIITRAGPVTPGALAQRIGLTAGAVTTVLDRLEAGGWIRRRRDTQDRRRILVERNDAKARRVGRLYHDLQRGTHRLAHRYSDSQLELIVEFLGATVGLVSTHRASLRKR